MVTGLEIINKEPLTEEDKERCVSSLLKEIDDEANNVDDFDEAAEEKDQLLNLNWWCACTEDGDVDMILEIKPQPPILDDYGVPIPTSGRCQRAPFRVMLTLDVSHSMSEPFNEDEGDMTKLERLKTFTSMYVKLINEEHKLGVVTFGTSARLVFPLKKMSQSNKEKALEAIQKIAVEGVTNISAGLLLAQDQFIHPQIGLKMTGPAYDDNIIVFTDGNPNEGITDSATMMCDFRTRTQELKDTYHYPDGYNIRIATMGTWGFMPHFIYDLGQRFSSDAYNFFDQSANMELNLFRCVLLRDATFVHRVKGNILALNGVTMNLVVAAGDYKAPFEMVAAADTESEMNFFMHDINEGCARHIPLRLTLPKKHQKRLKGQDILHISIEFMDRAFRTRTIQRTITYKDIPKKTKHNVEKDIVEIAKHENRLTAVRALNDACGAVAVLCRIGAREALEYGINIIQNHVDTISTMILVEDNFTLLTEYTQPLLDNLEHASAILDDLTLSWDDAWARLRALGSALARESPACTGVFAPGAELFEVRDVQRKLKGICKQLRERYKIKGIDTSLVEGYLEWLLAQEEMWNRIDFMDDEESIYCFDLKIN